MFALNNQLQSGTVVLLVLSAAGCGGTSTSSNGLSASAYYRWAVSSGDGSQAVFDDVQMGMVAYLPEPGSDGDLRTCTPSVVFGGSESENVKVAIFFTAPPSQGASAPLPAVGEVQGEDVGNLFEVKLDGVLRSYFDGSVEVQSWSETGAVLAVDGPALIMERNFALEEGQPLTIEITPGPGQGMPLLSRSCTFGAAPDERGVCGVPLDPDDLRKGEDCPELPPGWDEWFAPPTTTTSTTFSVP